MLSRVNMVALCKSVRAVCASYVHKVPAIVQAGLEAMKKTESMALAELQKIIEDAPNVVAGKAEEYRAMLAENFDFVADKIVAFVEACNSADHATMGIAGAALITTVILLGMSRRRGRKRASSNIAGLVEDVKDVTMETEVQEIEIPAENSAAGQAKEEGQANGENAADNTEDKMVDDDKAEAQDKAQDKDDKAEVKPENKVADQAKAQDKDDKAEVKPENKVADQAKDEAKDDKAEIKPENKVADQAKDEAKDAEKTLDSAANQAEDDKAEDDKAEDDKAEDDKAEDDKAEDDKAEDDKAEDDKAEDKVEDQAKAQAKDDKAEDSAADQAKDEYKDEDKTVEEDKEMKEYAIMGHHTGELDDSQSTGADVPNEMASISPADKKKKKSETTWKSHGTDREVPVQQAVQPSRSNKTNTSRRDVPACRPSKSTKHGRTGSKPKRAKYESLSERKSQPFTTRSSQRTSDRYGSNKEIPHDYVKRSREPESKTPEDILEDTQTQRRCASKNENETDVIELD